MKKFCNRVMNLIPIFSLILFASSCCTSKDCDYIMEESFYNISFNGFQQYEIDTVTIYTYEMNTNFNHPIDSIDVYCNYFYGTYNSINLNEPLSHKFDYIIKTEDKLYKISNYIFIRHSCNSCFLKSKNDYTYSLKSYELDGKRIEGSYLEINKY